MPSQDTAVIEFLILADHAEIVGGKLYMMGGGWERVRVARLDGVAIAVGVALRLGLPAWGTAMQHVIQLSVDGPGRPEITPGQFQFLPAPGRPDLRSSGVLLAAECQISLREPGLHKVIASVDGTAGATADFVVEVSQP